MRLIDADALLNDGVKVSCGHVTEEGLIMVPIRDVRQAIKGAPTIDPESLRPRGEWLEITDAYGDVEGWMHFECGRTVKSRDPFCPKCGAKME